MIPPSALVSTLRRSPLSGRKPILTLRDAARYITPLPHNGRMPPPYRSGFYLEAPSDRSAVRRNSRCMRATIVVMAWVDLSRSDFPNLTPLIVQFASRRDFGVSRWMITPTNTSQTGSYFLTASAIANCNSVHEIDCRSSTDRLPQSKDIIYPSGTRPPGK
jgi:hypothetical protein